MSATISLTESQMLTALRAAKLSGEYSSQISAIYFLYLCKPKQRLQRHLQRCTAGGSHRPADHQISILEHYDRFHKLFVDLADEIIDCSTASTTEVSLQVHLIAKEVVIG